MKTLFLMSLISIRILTNEGLICEKRSPKPKRQPPEVTRFIKKPAKNGKKKTNKYKQEDTFPE